ncbi:MAG: hypothetical protein HZB38_11095 [Planctomycetes bacterium]|nr:hypothetical protein [Planctomycetota bacterium]
MGEPGRVRVRNLAYLFAPHSEYPLASAARGPIDGIAAFAVDMDGTSTTTEPLALHALEYMVRRFTGRLTPRDWSGLDPVADYPNVIGHSNQHHTAFLLERYKAEYQPAALREAFLEALAWTLTHMRGAARASQVIETARMCGLQSVVTGDEFRGIARGAAGDAADGVEPRLLAFLAANSSALRLDLHAARVRAALDVYYMRYHSILLRVQRGDAAALSRELLGDSGRRHIEPMPGYAVFVALVKGWLGADASMLTNQHMGASTTAETRPVADARALTAYAKRYERTPAKLALVTASIGIEAMSTKSRWPSSGSG